MAVDTLVAKRGVLVKVVTHLRLRPKLIDNSFTACYTLRRMNIYLALKYHATQQNRALIETISAVLTNAGHRVTVAVRDLEQWGAVALAPDQLMRQVFWTIDRTDLVLLELSEKGVGLGIEAGYAHAQGIPVVVVAPHGTDISATLLGIATRVVHYGQPVELADLDLAQLALPPARDSWSYIVSSVERLLACCDALDPTARDWTPLSTSNSVTVLAVHMVGNIEETVLGLICGVAIERDRVAEFQAHDLPPDAIRARWQQVRARIEEQLSRQSRADLARCHEHPRRGLLSGHEILLVVARHAAEHVAQAELVRDLWLAEEHS